MSLKWAIWFIILGSDSNFHWHRTTASSTVTYSRFGMGGIPRVNPGSDPKCKTSSKTRFLFQLLGAIHFHISSCYKQLYLKNLFLVISMAFCSIIWCLKASNYTTKGHGNSPKACYLNITFWNKTLKKNGHHLVAEIKIGFQNWFYILGTTPGWPEGMPPS